MTKRLTITKDRVNVVIGSIHEIAGKQVLVGIPESTSTREEGPLTNAAIGYIQETGAPGSNIPARPFLVPGVRKSASAYIPRLRAAADAALNGNRSQANQELAGAGIVAEQGAKREIHSNIPPPLAPSTIRGRMRQRGAQQRRQSEEHYIKLVKGGMPPEGAQNATGIVSLINTGELANSITSVVRKAK